MANALSAQPQRQAIVAIGIASGGVMTKGLVDDLKVLEERMIKDTDRTEEHKKHNHQLTRQARVARRERHKRHTIEKHQGRAD
jgi:hypothetical protein